MTRRFFLKPFLIGHVSHGTLEYAAYPWIYAFHLEAGYGCEAVCSDVQPIGTLSFLAWIKAWLCVLVGMGEAANMQPAPTVSDAPLNRHFSRLRRNKSYAARQCDELAYHIYRRYGLKRCQQWLYNRGLIGRVRWCFGRAYRRGVPHESFASFTYGGLKSAYCAAPLSPD